MTEVKLGARSLRWSAAPTRSSSPRPSSCGTAPGSKVIREEVRMMESAEMINTITMNILMITMMIIMITMMINTITMMIITCRYPGLGGGMPGMNGPGIGC